jgi:hypothetical protein
MRQTGKQGKMTSSPQFAKHNGKLANCIAAAVSCMSSAFSSPKISVRRSEKKMRDHRRTEFSVT